MLTKHEVVEKFLFGTTLGHLYHEGLECFVKVEQGLGEKVSNGKGFSDGTEQWYDFRLNNPAIAKTKVGYDFHKRVESIGLSGWNYLTKQTEWCGFDFDSITGHKKGLSVQELDSIIERVKEIPWITIRRSRSGKGLHLYVQINQSPEITSHQEHRLFSKSVLSNLSALLRFDFSSKIDCCGSILWIWSKISADGAFETIQEAKEKYLNRNPTWKEEGISETKKQIKGITLANKIPELDAQHDLLIKWFANGNYTWWWDAELSMLVCHTHALAVAHQELKLKGIFFTIATGKDGPGDHNCFCFPLNNGAWIVRRYGIGCQEHSYWKVDKNGYTYCHFNRCVTLDTIAPIYGGKCSSKGDYIFRDCGTVEQFLEKISTVRELGCPPWARYRNITISPIKGAKVAIKFDIEKGDGDSEDWLKRKTWWEKVIPVFEEEKILKPPDEVIRHVVSSGEDAGWYIQSNGIWVHEPRPNVKDVLSSLSYSMTEISDLLGQCILDSWTLVNEPFGDEYPGGRKWNKFSPKLLFKPTEGKHPTWDLILDHIGRSLDGPVRQNNWCVAHSVTTGAGYLLLWISVCFREPDQPTPYLFLYGPQESGKSILHEALSLLVDRGVERAEIALTDQRRFNENLAGAIICVTDEFNLAANKGAYERLKDWITAKNITIHPKGDKPFQLANTTHWMQVANNPSFCPIQFGDTRMMLLFIDKPANPIPKQELIKRLIDEAPAFLWTIFNTEIPPPVDRMRIPVILTEEKSEHVSNNANPVEQFILDQMFPCPGHLVGFGEFCKRFQVWLDQSGGRSIEWSKRRVSASIPLTESMPIKGRAGATGDICLGNFSFATDTPPETFRWEKVGERLVKST
jgi:hypothetical protein